MRLNIIPIANVETALHVAEDKEEETDKFTTKFHAHAQIAAVIPDNASGPRRLFPDLRYATSTTGYHSWLRVKISKNLAMRSLYRRCFCHRFSKATAFGATAAPEELLDLYPKIYMISSRRRRFKAKG